MEEQEKKITKGWKRFWLVIGIVLFVSYFALLSVIVYLQWGQGQRYYLDGFNGTFNGLGRDFYSFLVWLVTLPIFTLTLIYVCFLKSMFKLQKHRLKRLLLVLLISLNPILTFILTYKFINLSINSSKYERFTEGYRDWVKSEMDIEEIRDWLSKHDGTLNRIGCEDFQGPRCLAENHSRLSAGFIFHEDGYKVLRIMSGGGFLDWGVVIGPEDMDVPDSETIKDDDEYSGRYGEYHLKLADGAYVYYELQ